MSDLTVRRVETDDVPALVEFLVKLDAHVAGVPPEELALTAAGERQLRQRIESFIDEPGKRLVVACAPDGRLAGMGHIHIWHYADIWLNPERRGLRSGYIDDLWVEPEFRGAGVARGIIDALLDYAAAEGIEELILEYAIHNSEAEALWRDLGFVPTGVRAAARLSEVRARLSAPRKDPPARRRGQGEKGARS